MQTIIVEITVPSISKRFDFRLPTTGCIGNVIDDIAYTLETTQQNISFNMADLILCDRDQRRILHRWETVAGAGLRDSSQLILL